MLKVLLKVALGPVVDLGDVETGGACFLTLGDCTELDTYAVCQHPRSIEEADVLAQLHEGKDVAAFAATKALEQAKFG